MKDIPQEAARAMLYQLLSEEFDCENDLWGMPCWRCILICQALGIRPVSVYPSVFNGDPHPEAASAIKEMGYKP
jgi:hypothetical protein